MFIYSVMAEIGDNLLHLFAAFTRNEEEGTHLVKRFQIFISENVGVAKSRGGGGGGGVSIFLKFLETSKISRISKFSVNISRKLCKTI